MGLAAQALVDKRLHLLAAADEVTRARALAPPDGGTLWRSAAQRQYAARVAELRGYLDGASVQLDDALVELNRDVAVALSAGAP